MKAPPGSSDCSSSDRSGVRELYSLELGDSLRTYLTARVATGIHDATVVASSRSAGVDSDRTTIVATVTHADGRHLERLDISRDRWVAVPSPAANATPRPADIEPPPLSEKDLFPTKPYVGARPDSARLVACLCDGRGVGSVCRWSDRERRCHRQALVAGCCCLRTGRQDNGIRLCVSPLRARRDVRTVRPTWRLEQRVESSVGELLRLERKRSAAFGVVFPWQTFQAATSVITSFQIEDRYRENAGDFSGVERRSDQQDPTLVGGGLRLRFGNVQAGLRSISVQDGVGLFAGIDYLKATEGDRWRSGWELGGSLCRSFPSWTTSGRPVSRRLCV